MAMKPGTQIGSYRIGAALGAGGMGEVYRATDSKLKRDVAIKILPDEFARDPERLARLEREAQLLASLNHQNIAAIYGLEEFEGSHCLVLELVEGETLAERQGGEPLALDETIDVARQLAGALESAHERGIIHRDLKPANVMITQDGTVKVLDFGLAKALEEDAGVGSSVDISHSPTLTAAATRAGVILGTAAYMSPEQARGRSADKRADIWSFGAVLFEMLSGRQPFTGETISDILASILKETPDWGTLPSEVPAALRALAARCLEKDALRRLRDIGEARIILEGDLSAVAATPDGGDAMRAAPGAQSLLPWLLAGVMGVAAIVAWWSPWRPEPSILAPVRVLTTLSEEPLDVENGASVALSPDGRWLAYVAGVGAERRLHLRAMSQLESSELSGTEGAVNPFFSQDGQWLAFFADGKLKKVSIQGGPPLALADAPVSRGGAWGRGGTIVFAACTTCPLSRIPAAGGAAEPLTVLEEARGERSHRWPAFLPDGEHVLFSARVAGVSVDDAAVELVSLKTGERKLIHQGGTFPRALPTGHVAFLRGGTLLAAPLDPRRLELTAMPTPLLEDVLTFRGGGQYAFSETGTLVYLRGSQAGARASIISVGRDGSEETLVAEEQSYEDIRLSPDGGRLAVEVNMPGGEDVIWVHDLARGTMTRLTFAAGGSFNPVWTPDGRDLVFGASPDIGDLPSLFRKRADGAGDLVQLTQGDSVSIPFSTSPDGKLVAYAVQDTGDTGWDLWTVPIDGEGDPEVFLATSFTETNPEFSPDGRWLAYLSNQSGDMEVYVRPFPGPGGRWQISTGGGGSVRWARDGSELFYRSGDRVMAVAVSADGDSFQAGRPQILFEAAYLHPGGFSEAFDVLPDGRGFVMLDGSRADVAGRRTITFIFNWFEEIRRLTS